MTPRDEMRTEPDERPTAAAEPIVGLALALAAQGMRVFPATAYGAPLVAHWRRAASTSPARIRAWWKRWPSASVALVCGRSSRVLALRVQGELGEIALAKLEREHGALPRTPEIASRMPPSDRLLFFRADRKLPACRKIGAGLTSYGDGAFLVLPAIAPSTQVAS